VNALNAAAVAVLPGSTALPEEEIQMLAVNNSVLVSTTHSKASSSLSYSVDKRAHLQVLICNCGSWACSADTADEPSQGRCKSQEVPHVAYYDVHMTL
jgi:hypothetical protein